MCIFIDILFYRDVKEYKEHNFKTVKTFLFRRFHRK